MSDAVLALLLTLVVLALLFAWVPMLDRVCPPCGRLVRSLRRRTPREAFAKQEHTGAVRSRG